MLPNRPFFVHFSHILPCNLEMLSLTSFRLLDIIIYMQAWGNGNP